MSLITKLMRGFLGLSVLVFIPVLFGCGAGVSPFEKIVELSKPPAEQPAYVYVPFDVPPGAESVSVKLEYDKRNGKNRLELGVFDERFSGEHEDKEGFRGWSGSVRDGFFIGRETATKGYQPGEIKPGRWYVILGLAELETGSLKAKLSFSFEDIPAELKKTYDDESSKSFTHAKPKIAAKSDWLRGDLHAHTFHGDGKWSVKAILDSAKANKLDFVAITEHNTFSHHSEIDRLSGEYDDLLVLKGQEITTYGGHINAWGLPTGQWVDFRAVPYKPESAAKIKKEANLMGAFVSINHPTMDCSGCNWTYGDWSAMNSVEVWNADWDPQDEEALRLWDRELQKGNRIVAIGSSDTHQPPYEPSDYPTNRAVGSPTVFVKAEGLHRQLLFDSILKGRAYVAEDPDKAVLLTLSKGAGLGDTAYVGQGHELDYFVRLKGFSKGSNAKVIWKLTDGTNGRLNKAIDGADIEFESSLKVNAPGFVRLEVRNPDGSMAAFTNPIWISEEEQ